MSNVVFQVSARIAELGQNQITISPASDPEVLAALAEAKCSRKAGRIGVLACTLKDSNRVDLLVGDTHAIWRQHQPQASLALFDAIYEARGGIVNAEFTVGRLAAASAVPTF